MAAASGDPSRPNRSTAEDVPGEPIKMATSALDTGATVVQKMAPVRQICQHLCGVHFYAHDMTRQVEAHHYCSHLTEDVMQCLIYDSDQSNARLIGVEFIVSEKVFAALPADEKRLWHSHEYEVKSGLLRMPLLPSPAEHAVMQKLVKTYGKTWHFWQFDRGDVLPLGVPQLMGAFTHDGQIFPGLVEGMENRLKLSVNSAREIRKDFKGPDAGIDPNADYCIKTGKGFEVILKETELKTRPAIARV